MANTEDKKRLKKTLKRARIILIITFLSFFVWLFYKNFAPTGKLNLSYNFNKEPEFINFVRGINNPEKSIDGNVTYSRVTENPAEFKLNMPRLFKSVEIEIKYIGTYSLLCLSSKKKNSNHYETKLLNMDLANSEDWKRTASKDKKLVLYQQYKDEEYEEDNETYIKPKPEFKYKSVEGFLNDIDNIIKKREKKIAYLNYDLSDKVKIDNYNLSDEINIFDKTIRGKHEIITYLGENENFDFKFYYQDMNRYDGPDRFNVTIDRGNNTLARYTEEDDGDDLASGSLSELKELHITKENFDSGKYKIILDISDDLYVQKIETKQKYFAFQGGLFLENPKQSANLYTNAQSLYFKTLHEEGLGQNIKSERLIEYDEKELREEAREDNEEINEEEIKEKLDVMGLNKNNEIVLEEEMENYNLSTPGVINKFEVPVNDVVISYGGLISNSSEAIDKLSDLEEYVYPLDNNVNFNDTDYIITDYFQEAKKEGPYKIVKQDFDLSILEVSEKNEVNFSLNIDNYNRNVEDLRIANIKFTLKKDPWNFKFFKDKIKNLLN